MDLVLHQGRRSLLSFLRPFFDALRCARMAPNVRGAPVLEVSLLDRGAAVSLCIGQVGWLCYMGCGAGHFP